MSNIEIHGFDPNKYIPEKSDNSQGENANQQSKKNRHSFYKSSTRPGSFIVNAEDGTRYNYLVGSVDEERFFTVMVNDGKECAKLFYNSPEQYESHRRVTLDDSIKIKWKEQEIEQRMNEKQINEENEESGVTVVK